MKNLPKVVKVIFWILFWYYLIPYYLLKKFVFSKSNRSVIWSAISSIAILFVLFCIWGNSLPDDDTESNEAEVHYETKKVGSSELKQAVAKQQTLSQEEKKKQAEYEKLSHRLDEEKAQAKQEAEKETAASDQQAAPSQPARSHHRDVAPHDDMNTAQTGQIVGNRNSKIYHVPGQAGYRMNSANAVYFNSEQDAINAGYRKAKR